MKGLFHPSDALRSIEMILPHIQQEVIAAFEGHKDDD